ncbi:ABC transporter permease [Mailhella massiliensis]|uniref:ABC transporter permease n=1 Tax=Mailhella massiliensis TaxID=1903261 RepID=A0A921DS51_9BACT|nr:ABC transporter permease [Mailhella massiliensis]HJD97788.1 ABC transporter permease [Mailhella massiliensis]
MSFFDGASLCVAFLTVLFLTASLGTIIVGGLPFLPGALCSEEVLFSIRLSLVTSTVSTLLCFVVGIPCAYALARCRMPLRNVCRLVLELPLSLPYLVLGLCLLMMFSSEAGRMLKNFGIRVIFEPAGIVMAQWIVNIPFVIRLMRTALEEMDSRLEFIAGTLGASRWQRFCTITLPLCRNSILMAAILTWSRAIGEFGATLMLVGVTRMKTETLPASIYLNISTGDNGMAMAAAIILLIISGTALLFSTLLQRRAASRMEGSFW